MHDLCDHKFFDGNIKEELENILKRLNVYDYISSNDRENIINSCMNLGFSSNIINKKELSKEGKIAQDADRLDGMGAIGIARTFAYGGAHGRSIEDSMKHFDEKLLLLKNAMNTKEGRSIASSRHDFLETFVDEIREETNLLRE